ncbi:ADP-ribosylation factor-like protein 15, partial [Oryzias melastigma]
SLFHWHGWLGLSRLEENSPSPPVCPLRATHRGTARRPRSSRQKQFHSEIKKYFELEPLARGKRWILEGSSTNNLEAVKESFAQFINLLEDKDTEPARI